LCVLPWLGFVPDGVRAAPAVAVSRLVEQLRISPEEHCPLCCNPYLAAEDTLGRTGPLDHEDATQRAPLVVQVRTIGAEHAVLTGPCSSSFLWVLV
jgi:hypothetical protein